MPEKHSKKPRGEVKILTAFCKGCELCVQACALGCLDMSGPRNIHAECTAAFNDPEHKCSGCTLCFDVCPHIALTVYKEKEGGKKNETIVSKGE